MYFKKLKIALFAVIIISAFTTGCSREKKDPIKSGEDLSMFIATDIHYLAKSINDNGTAFQKFWTSGDGRQLNYIDEIVDSLEYDIKQKSPDILIVSGDLTTNGEKESHLELAQKFKDIEASTGTSVYVIPGNHDIDNPWARGFKGDEQYKTPSVEASEFKDIYKDFGYGEAISKDLYSLSYLAAPSEDVWLLMLDASEYRLNDKAGTPITNGEISDNTMKWIEKCSKLAKEKNARIVTVMHHNLYNHSARIHYGFTLDNSNEVEKLFREYNLNLVLSGHLHIQDIRYKGDGTDRIYDIVTSALVMYPIQYGILDYSPSTGFDYSTARVDVEAWAKATGVTDSNLTDFSNYSKNYFTNISYQKSKKAITATGKFTEEEVKEMAETMSLLNANYFSGTTLSIKDQVEASEGYKLWIGADEIEALESLRSYILSMMPHNDTNNNSLHID